MSMDFTTDIGCSASQAVLLSRPFLGLETETEILAIRYRDRDLDKMNSSLETMVSRSQHWSQAFT